MTDSPRLEEVIGRVLIEHQTYGLSPFLCSCGWQAPRETPRPSIVEHQAERLAARFEELGIVADAGGGEIRVLVDRDLKDYPAQRVPVFRLVGGDQ